MTDKEKIKVLEEALERASFVALSVSVHSPPRGAMGEAYNKGAYVAAEAVYFLCRSVLSNTQ